MTHHHLVLAAVTSIGLVAAGGNVQSAEKLSLRVTPNVSNAPCNLIVQAIIPKHRENRWLVIEAESGEFYRSSAVELDGDKAPVVTEIRFNNLPSGDYTIAASLRDQLGIETTVRGSLIVLPRFGEP